MMAGWLFSGLAAGLEWLIPTIEIPKPQWQEPQTRDGGVRPVVFGTVRLQQPYIIWFGDKLKDGEFFGASVHYELCHGKLDKLRRVVVADKVAYDGELDSEDACFIGAVFDGVHNYAFDDAKNGDFIDGVVYFWPGEVDDTPGANPGTADGGWRDILAAKQGLNDGVGPSYAGRATVFATLPRIGKTPTLKPFAFDVQRIHTRDGGAEAQWYDAKAEITVGANREDTWKYLVVGPTDSTDRSAKGFDDSGWDTGPGGIGNAPAQSYTSSAHDEEDKDSGPWQGYDTPPVRTQIDTGLGFTGGTWPTTWVETGTQIWMRKDLGKLPPAPLGVMCWHDDTAELWFNGTSITLEPIYSPTDPDYIKFHSRAVIPASLIDAAGVNVVAYKVTDTGTKVVQSKPTGRVNVGRTPDARTPPTTSNEPETGDYIYAGIQIGPNLAKPEKVVDMNSVHVIREVLTDTIWGAGRAEAKMGDTFTDAADTCYDEMLGISCEWRGEEGGGSIAEFISEVLRHISGVLYLDRATGKYEIKLIREDYVVGSLPVFDSDSIESIEDASRPTPDDMINSVVVSYRNSIAGDDATTPPIMDPGAIAAQGIRTKKIEYPWLTTQFNAYRAAMTCLRVGASPFLTLMATLSRQAAGLQIGDPVVVTWSPLDIDELVMRVKEISLGDGRNGKVKVKLVEEVFFSPEPETLVVPAGYDHPMVTLGPLVVEQSKWITTQAIDPVNRGSFFCVFSDQLGPADILDDFVEIEPGVWEFDGAAGPIGAQYYDGIDLRVADSTFDAVAAYVGRVVLVHRMTTNYPERRGFYVLKSVGGYWLYDQPGTVFVSEKVRLERAPGYQYSADYVQGLTLQCLNGDVYEGKYFTLLNASVALGSTGLVFDISDTKSWSTVYRLLTEPQLVTEAAPIDTMYASATMAAGTTDFPDGFNMLTGAMQQQELVPAYWDFYFEAVWLTADDPAATIALGVKVWRTSSDPATTGVLFEALSGDFHSTDPIPLHIRTWYKGCKVDPTDTLVLILTLHTTSVGAVTLNVRYNSPARQTYMLAPFRSPDSTQAQSGRYLSTSVSADGVITVPPWQESSVLTLAPGTVIHAIDQPNIANGARIAFTINGGNGNYDDRIVFKHLQSVTGRQKAIYINAEGEDMYITASVARFEVQYSLADGYWHLMTGGIKT